MIRWVFAAACSVALTAAPTSSDSEEWVESELRARVPSATARSIAATSAGRPDGPDRGLVRAPAASFEARDVGGTLDRDPSRVAAAETESSILDRFAALVRVPRASVRPSLRSRDVTAGPSPRGPPHLG